MNTIIDHVWTPDHLMPQSIRGLTSLTAETLERLYQKEQAALRQAKTRLERQVQVPTVELARSNVALQAERQAHQQVEHARTQQLRREQALRRKLEGVVAALRTTEQRFRRLFDANIIGIVFSDFSGGKIEANDAFLEIIGYTREDLQAGRGGTIHLHLGQDQPGSCVLSVGNTGIGLPCGLDVHTTASLGWYLVRLLTAQLRGTLHLERHPGTTVTITFPL